MVTKIALVGIGKIAVDQHVPAIQASPDWELAATVSRQGNVDGVESFTDIDRLLETCQDIACISFCLPPVPRFDYAAKALKAGRHVMLEKPPGATLAECFALEKMAQTAGVALFASWHSREAARVDDAKLWLVGKNITSVRITWKEDVRIWHPGQKWIWEAGGLGVFDPGINALSILTKILPDPVHLIHSELLFPQNCETPIAANLEFSHPAGADVSAVLDFRYEGEQTWDILAETTEGTLLLSQGGAVLTIDGKQYAQADTISSQLVGEYPRLYAHLHNLIGGSTIDMDISPLVHVADAFLLGKRKTVEAFHE